MLGFNIHDVINTKVQAILQAIKEAFGEKNTKTEFNVLGYGIDIYFHGY